MIIDMEQEIIDMLSDKGIYGNLSIEKKEGVTSLSFICDDDWLVFRRSYNDSDENIANDYVSMVVNSFIEYSKHFLMSRLFLNIDTDADKIKCKIDDKQIYFDYNGKTYIAYLTWPMNIAESVSELIFTGKAKQLPEFAQ